MKQPETPVGCNPGKESPMTRTLRRIFWNSIFVVCAYQFFYPLFGAYCQVPLWTATKARDRFTLLKPGMTEAQVWTTLDLSGYSIRSSEGSGPQRDYRRYYSLWKGYTMRLCWNDLRHPKTFTHGEFYVHGVQAEAVLPNSELRR